MLAAMALVAALVLPSCARFQPTSVATSPSDYTPSAMLQSVTMKNSSIRYDPAVLKRGSSRSQVEAAFGEPNATQTTDTGQTEDVYAFNPDGTKFVNPQVRPRNLALAFFTSGMSLAVRQARLKMAERKLTLYHVLYASDGFVESIVRKRCQVHPRPAAARGRRTPHRADRHPSNHNLRWGEPVGSRSGGASATFSAANASSQSCVGCPRSFCVIRTSRKI
jgi:hypothetical protein